MEKSEISYTINFNNKFLKISFSGERMAPVCAR